MCVKGIDCVSFYNLSIGFWKRFLFFILFFVFDIMFSNRQHSTSETLYHSLNRQHNTSETLYQIDNIALVKHYITA
jgi:hypothetical protein